MKKPKDRIKKNLSGFVNEVEGIIKICDDDIKHIDKLFD